jgi:hypothetical protein
VAIPAGVVAASCTGAGNVTANVFSCCDRKRDPRMFPISSVITKEDLNDEGNVWMNTARKPSTFPAGRGYSRRKLNSRPSVRTSTLFGDSTVPPAVTS